MGLGIDINAAYAGSEAECRERLQAFLDREKSVVPGKSVSTVTYGDVLRASFFFAEEDVYFQFAEGNRLSINAKTNSVGPGYHAYLVNVFERMREECSLAWDDETVADDTDYWHNRDFEELQHAMADWLESLAGSLVENHMGDGISGLAICMGTDRVPEGDDHYAAHLLGWLERDFFLSVSGSGPTPQDCERFYIWWEEDRGAEFFLQCAKTMLWCDCNWLAPFTEYETHLFTAALLCLENAWDDNPALPYPVQEWRELAELSQSREILEELDRRFPGPVPSMPLIGYRRGDMRYNLGSGWRITMPGALHEDVDGEDGTVQVFWDDSRTVRVSRYSVSGDAVSAESLLDTVTSKVENAEDFPLRPDREFLARVVHEPQEGEDGNEYFGSFFFAASDAGKVLYMSVFYNDESVREWAESIFTSCSWQNG